MENRAGRDGVRARRRGRGDRNGRWNGARVARAGGGRGARDEKSGRARSRSRSRVVGG